MKDTAIVFARAPRLGRVKRRLAQVLGERAALRFHRTTLVALLRRLAADRRFRTVLAMTPDQARFAVPSRVRRIDQGGGDLGQRMDRALRRFKYGRAAIVGADIPDAGPADLAAAFRVLGTADAAFGPAGDGGYWLVALGPRRPDRPFAHVRWSSKHALSETLRNFPGRRVALLRVLHDVDTAADFLRLSQNRQTGLRPQGPVIEKPTRKEVVDGASRMVARSSRLPDLSPQLLRQRQRWGG